MPADSVPAESILPVCVCMCVREGYSKALAQVMMEASKSPNYQAGLQADWRSREPSMLLPGPQADRRQISLLLGSTQPFPLKAFSWLDEAPHYGE